MSVNHGMDEACSQDEDYQSYQRRDTATILYETINAFYRPVQEKNKKKRHRKGSVAKVGLRNM